MTPSHTYLRVFYSFKIDRFPYKPIRTVKLVDPFSAHNSAQKKLHKMLFTNQALRWSLLPMPIHYYGVQSMRVCVRTNSDAVPFTIRFLPVFSFRGHSLGFICERFESSIFSAQVGRQNCL